MKIYVSGSLAFDRIMDFPGYFKDNILPDKIHNLNVSFNIHELKENYGGTAGNIAYNLSLFALKPTILGSAGKDFEKYKKYLEDKGIDTGEIRMIDDVTACAYIITDKADNQITGFFEGALKYSCQPRLQKADLAIIAAGNVQDMMSVQDQCEKLDIPYIFDPGQALPILQPEELRALIQHSKAFISNDYELSLVCEKADLKEEEILAMTEILITTLAAKGSTITSKQAKIEIPAAKPKEVLDPTGAGDAYRAGFIAGLLANKDLATSGRMGSLAAVYAIENYGTQNHYFTLAEFWQRFKENF